MRQKNRDEYAQKRQNPYYKPIPPQDAQPIQRSTDQQQQNEQQSPQPKGPKNKYGDVWAQ